MTKVLGDIERYWKPTCARVTPAFLIVFIIGCAAVIPNRAPLGQPFPGVQGTSLSGVDTRLPDDCGGALCVLMVGYTRASQFDIDRWLLGLNQLSTPVRVIEVPTIPGLFPGLFAEQIDGGMRRGIPREDWPAVVTLYDDAERVTAFLGTEGKDNARVVLLDPQGWVIWVHDRGYSAALVSELDREVRAQSVND